MKKKLHKQFDISHLLTDEQKIERIKDKNKQHFDKLNNFKKESKKDENIRRLNS